MAHFKGYGGVTPDLRLFSDNLIPTIVVDHKEYTPSRPFCWNPSCPCHEYREAIAEISQAVQNGVMTPQNATNCVPSKLVQGGMYGIK